MATLVIDNMPASLFDRIQRLAKAQHRTPADAALDVLENALGDSAATRTEAPLPSEPFLTEEICAPVTIPWPAGELVNAVHVEPPLPTAHDIPPEE